MPNSIQSPNPFVFSAEEYAEVYSFGIQWDSSLEKHTPQQKQRFVDELAKCINVGFIKVHCSLDLTPEQKQSFITSLANSSGLGRLELNLKNLTAAEIRQIGAALSDKNELTDLIISIDHESISDETFQAYLYLLSTCKAKKIDFIDIKDNDFKLSRKRLPLFLNALASNKKVQEVVIERLSFVETCLAHDILLNKTISYDLTVAQEIKDLKDDAFRAYLCGLEHSNAKTQYLPKISELSIERLESILKAYASNPKLENLYIGSVDASTSIETWELFAQYIPSCNLKSIIIHNSSILSMDDAKWDIFLQMLYSCSTVEEFSLQDEFAVLNPTKITSFGVALLGMNLKALALMGNSDSNAHIGSFTEEQCAALGYLFFNLKLKKLSLFGNNIGESANFVFLMQAIAENKLLLRLDLALNGLENLSVQQIKDLVAVCSTMPKLQYIRHILKWDSYFNPQQQQAFDALKKLPELLYVGEDTSLRNPGPVWDSLIAALNQRPSLRSIEGLLTKYQDYGIADIPRASAIQLYSQVRPIITNILSKHPEFGEENRRTLFRYYASLMQLLNNENVPDILIKRIFNKYLDDRTPILEDLYKQKTDRVIPLMFSKGELTVKPARAAEKTEDLSEEPTLAPNRVVSKPKVPKKSWHH